MKQSLLIYICFLFLPLTAKGQVAVEAHLDTASILIGEQVQLRVKCTAKAGQQVNFPYFQPQQELTPGVEVVDNGRTDTTRINGGQRMELTRRYTITAWDSALYRLPPFKVTVDGKEYASHGNIGLKVNTVAVDTVHVDKFNGPHDVVDLPFEWTWRQTLTALAAWLLAAACLALAVRRSDPRLITRRVVIQPPTPPHITAIKGIEHIKQKPAADAKTYYMQLTETLRSYIERRFGFNAREMTTQEIIDQLCATDHAAALAELKDVLLTADLVKFAKHDTSIMEQDRSLMQALNYVQTTKLVPSIAPKPRVEYVTLSGRRQHLLRRSMTLGAWLTGAAAISLTAYVAYDIYCCFL